MKKLACVLLTFVLLIPTISIAETTTDGFTYGSGIKFGMTMKEVKQIAGVPEETSDTMFVYTKTKTAGEDSYTAFVFNENTLNTIYIIFTGQHSNNNDYIGDFDDIDEALVKKYGTPSIDQFYHWKNSLFKDDTEQYGLAIAAGHLVIISTWNVSGVVITHTISGDNYETNHGIIYRPEDYEESTDTNGL